MKRKIFILGVIILSFLILSAFIYANSKQDIADKGTVINGDFILTDDNYEKAKSIETIKGNLVLDNSKKAFMPSLKHIEKGLYVENKETLEVIELPELLEIRNIHIARTKKLTNIKLSKLNRVNWGIKVEYNDNLKEVNLSKLQYVGKNITINKNYKLKILDFSSIKNINENIFISSNDSLKNLNLGSLEEVEDIDLWDTLIKNFKLPKLKSSDGIYIMANENLVKVTFDKLENINKKIYFKWNRKLEKIKMPQIKHIGIEKNFQ
ncbi:hypothetical protein JCM16358_23760 [Halanaerocella petrolearia]